MNIFISWTLTHVCNYLILWTRMSSFGFNPDSRTEPNNSRTFAAKFNYTITFNIFFFCWEHHLSKLESSFCWFLFYHTHHIQVHQQLVLVWRNIAHLNYISIIIEFTSVRQGLSEYGNGRSWKKINIIRKWSICIAINHL